MAGSHELSHTAQPGLPPEMTELLQRVAETTANLEPPAPTAATAPAHEQTTLEGIIDTEEPTLGLHVKKGVTDPDLLDTFGNTHLMLRSATAITDPRAGTRTNYAREGYISSLTAAAHANGTEPVHTREVAIVVPDRLNPIALLAEIDAARPSSSAPVSGVPFTAPMVKPSKQLDFARLRWAERKAELQAAPITAGTVAVIAAIQPATEHPIEPTPRALESIPEPNRAPRAEDPLDPTADAGWLSLEGGGREIPNHRRRPRSGARRFIAITAIAATPATMIFVDAWQQTGR